MKIEKKIPKDIEKFLKILSVQGSLFGEIYLEHTETFKLVVEPERIDEINWGKEEGIAFRKIDENLKNHFAYSSDLENLSELEDLVKGVTKETFCISNRKEKEFSEKE
ncbi:MAG TPA: hypothetical protein ENI03_01535, partial [Thermodesulfobacterium geofontis]|nr:hypothetical protein [Thermodesulfobacterium geofontis]